MAGKFLVAVDASEGSERALNTAIALAKNTDNSITIAHVIEWSPFSFHTPEELAERHKRREEELDRAKQAMLAPAAAAVEAAGLKCETIVQHGHPSETLAALAQDSGALQIFIGRKGQSKAGLLLFGSVASSLIQISAVPVTVVP